jgi:outer membrane lipoprotein-sorting protein
MKLKEAQEASVTQVNKHIMMKVLIVINIAILLFASCEPTKKIQSVISKNKRDTTGVVVVNNNKTDDSLRFIKKMLSGIQANHIDFRTFKAKVGVNYVDADDKDYNVNANIRMYKDSIIWISVNAIFGIEALRALITKDSVKILDKQNELYTARSIKYLQDVSALPLNLSSLQDLLIGNPVFLDSNIVSYSKSANTVSLLSIGSFFKNLITLDENQKLMQRCKLDDVKESRNRTCDLSYGDYDNKRGVVFSTTRKISVSEQKKLDIRLEFKQYNFNEELSFPFSIPKNYKRN